MEKGYDWAINQKVKELRDERNFTQERIAELVGMKTSTYSQMERSGKIPIHTILKLAQIFEVNVMEILEPDNPRNALIVEPTPSGIIEQPPTIEKDDYCIRAGALSNREENAIIMLRNLKPEDRESVYAMIKEYHDRRLKRK